jgi:hypothetical protein
MKRFIAAASATETPFARSYQIVACPECHASFRVYRSPSPHIDERGFESYSLECMRCDTQLLGIIDPADNKLVLSEQSAPRKPPVAEKGERKPKSERGRAR